MDNKLACRHCWWKFVEDENRIAAWLAEVMGARLKYQWQIRDEKRQRWVDLPGFTDPILSRDDIEKKWDGCRFRCVVTDTAGTQISSREAVLRVRDRVPTGDDSNLPLYLAVAFVALALLLLNHLADIRKDC